MAFGAGTDQDHAFMFLNENEAHTIEAISERIFPADESGPGATEAAAIVYIDRALAGYGRSLQRLYRRGVRALNQYAAQLHDGMKFSELPASQQDEIISVFLDGKTSPTIEENERALLTEFIGAVRLHTLEGVFCDPMYGGNRNAVGWKLIGFPGAQWGYTADQMKLGFDATKIPIKTLADLRREHAPKRDEK